jgi:hypothetical protein
VDSSPSVDSMANPSQESPAYNTSWVPIWRSFPA